MVGGQANYCIADFRWQMSIEFRNRQSAIRDRQ